MGRWTIDRVEDTSPLQDNHAYTHLSCSFLFLLWGEAEATGQTKQTLCRITKTAIKPQDLSAAR